MSRLLIINPGSTSTKIGVYEDALEVKSFTLRHEAELLGAYEKVIDQLAWRTEEIKRILRENGMPLEAFDAYVGRGGLLRPMESGTYRVNEAMLKDLQESARGEHASNLGALIAHALGEEYGKEAFIADPVVVDELEDIARISGLKELEKISIFHALNQKAVAKRYAKEKGENYQNLNLIVVHLGGGISIGVHAKGRVVDVNNALNGEGPFSPERSGSLPVRPLVELCFSGKYTKGEILKMITGKGGFVSYLGTNDARVVEERMNRGDAEAKLIYEAMAYQIAKEIGGAATVLKGKIDAILITGGIAYSPVMVGLLKERVAFLAPVVIYPGEDELLALAEAASRVLHGEEEARVYGSAK
ncbi:butyrate kinase [Proteiniclasticum sp. BAD-10]|uniref:Probable butyrate kinase n=1 Tax=Proteiniclasticum sediminis TaxID=2804028 RepID=A0A941CQL4_9CLOT|nr:butyrate kinase [Proteiniclasticum sediminis]MBR0576960.1 butyrate kinase [Proteiniclasticum sediminis]